MATRVVLLNGPNLNMLGKRQPAIYGHTTLADVEAQSRALGAELGLEVVCKQSNAEHELIGWIHEARDSADAIIINPGAYSHTSIAILDALKVCEKPIVEVHISNIHQREEFRHHSYVSLVANGVIAGLGVNGYLMALRHIAWLMAQGSRPV